MISAPVAHACQKPNERMALSCREMIDGSAQHRVDLRPAEHLEPLPRPRSSSVVRDRGSTSGASWTTTIRSHGQGAHAARNSASRVSGVGRVRRVRSQQRADALGDQLALAHRALGRGETTPRTHPATIRVWAPKPCRMSSLPVARGRRAMARPARVVVDAVQMDKQQRGIGRVVGRAVFQVKAHGPAQWDPREQALGVLERCVPVAAVLGAGADRIARAARRAGGQR